MHTTTSLVERQFCQTFEKRNGNKKEEESMENYHELINETEPVTVGHQPTSAL